jgi:hypothetical protein
MEDRVADLTPEQIERLTQQRTEQGLPPTVEDDAALDALADLILLTEPVETP